jgi:hypothetical protein
MLLFFFRCRKNSIHITTSTVLYSGTQMLDMSHQKDQWKLRHLVANPWTAEQQTLGKHFTQTHFVQVWKKRQEEKKLLEDLAPTHWWLDSPPSSFGGLLLLLLLLTLADPQKTDGMEVFLVDLMG